MTSSRAQNDNEKFEAEIAFKESLKKIDQLREELETYFRSKREVFIQDDSSEYKKVVSIRKKLKNEYKQCVNTQLDLLSIKIEDKSALGILNQATSALAEFERFKEMRVRVLSKPSVDVELSNHLEVIKTSLTKLKPHLEKDPRKLTIAEKEIYKNPENLEGFSDLKAAYNSLQRQPIESAMGGLKLANQATHAFAHLDKLEASAKKLSDYEIAVQMQYDIGSANDVEAKHIDTFQEKESYAKTVQVNEFSFWNKVNDSRIKEVAHLIVYSPTNFEKYLNQGNKDFVQDNWDAIYKYAESGLTMLKQGSVSVKGLKNNLVDEHIEQAQANMAESTAIINDDNGFKPKGPR